MMKEGNLYMTAMHLDGLLGQLRRTSLRWTGI
jgi:hypothetical protein